ncbi:MAG TPA: M23 family metallopeptidase, partial [Candidatus Wirthbacteria bacterium]|nr:M23 family metallopeptidase [Candidatus Wirthbacteria bacterium]
SHTGQMAKAYDFNTTEGEALRASASGTVTFTKKDVTTCGGWSERNNVNRVVINHEHDAGYASLYLHMQNVAVSDGQYVRQGDYIGTSGKTGYTDTGSGCYPHLHFQRQAQGVWIGQSYEIYFDEYPGLQLQKGSFYISNNTGSCSPPATGDWILNSSCTIHNHETAPNNVTINNGATLTIDKNGSLDIDFKNKKMQIKNGGKVMILGGGKIY